MARYLCVYYTAKTLAKVNKTTKKVIVIDTDDPKVTLSVEGELKIVHKTKFIKYIRNMETGNIRANNEELKTIEYTNNTFLHKIKT